MLPTNKKRRILARCADKWGWGLVIPREYHLRLLLAGSLARRTGESELYIRDRLNTFHRMMNYYEQERNDSSLEKKDC